MKNLAIALAVIATLAGGLAITPAAAANHNSDFGVCGPAAHNPNGLKNSDGTPFCVADSANVGNGAR